MLDIAESYIILLVVTLFHYNLVNSYPLGFLIYGAPIMIFRISVPFVFLPP